MSELTEDKKKLDAMYDFVETVSFKTAEEWLDKAIELEKERDNLRAKLEAADQRIYELETYAESKIEVPVYLAIKQDRDNLQAANVVLRGALESVKEKFDYKMMHPDYTDYVSGEVFESGTLECVDKALSTTPAEAGERVQKVINAAQDVIDAGLLPDDYEACQMCAWQRKLTVTECEKQCPIGKLDDALAKYRGGADGE